MNFYWYGIEYMGRKASKAIRRGGEGRGARWGESAATGKTASKP